MEIRIPMWFLKCQIDTCVSVCINSVSPFFYYEYVFSYGRRQCPSDNLENKEHNRCGGQWETVAIAIKQNQRQQQQQRREQEQQQQQQGDFSVNGKIK